MSIIDSRFTLEVQFDVKRIEEVVRQYWHDINIEGRWREGPGNTDKWFTFLEGPPTTNGFPHVGHIRGRTYKDVVLRYHRLLGYRVWAQGGWDEQGLPVEIEVEKKLGLSTKKDIEKVGYEKFSLECNSLVDYYLEKWREVGTRRLGLWLDLDRAYETRRPYYIEHVWSFLKNAWEKGLLFEDYRVLPFCPRCETALSDAEVDQGYEDREDPSIFVKFPVEGTNNTYLVIWTTTPWTLVDNEAVAVNPNFNYALVRVIINNNTEYLWLAEPLVPRLMEKFGIKDYEIVRVVKGSELAGIRYRHIYMDKVPIHAGHIEKAHYVVLADFVTLEDGTGLVHIAPAHGPEDFEVAKKYGLPITNSVEINGIFNETGGEFRGKYWLDVSQEVIRDLKERGLLLHYGTITHAYPHCWRCGTPLIYRSDRQWFIRVSAYRDRLVEELRKVKIYPDFLRDRFDNWVANARDWTISRSRVWGTPLPVWRCKDDPSKVLVIGSLDELRKYAKFIPNVPSEMLVHRPWIDMVRIETEDCKEWVRESFVVDVWMDSGVAWIASVDGLRNKELFNRLYPYDWVTEAIDQTRGWFYSLLVTSVLWMNKAPYKSILISGHVVDKYGQKMSKSKGNVVWAEDLFNKWGADPTRLYLLIKSSPWDTMSVDPDEIMETRSALSILWNIVKFADTYMTLDKFDPAMHRLEELIDKGLIEDKWILSRFYSRLRRFINYMDNMELHMAAREWIGLVVDDLSHGYIRLIRRRVWIEESREDKYAAYSILYYVIKGALIMGSALVPHITEYLWNSFIRRFEKNEVDSVHLTLMPQVNEKYINEKLESAFDSLFMIFSDIAEMRNRIKVKLRWPLARAVIKVDGSNLDMLRQIKHLLEYLANVKEVEFVSELGQCNESEYVRAQGKGYEICLSKVIDKRLYYEALAREVVRRIQTMRAKANLKIDERIRVYVNTGNSELLSAISEYRDYVMNEVRAIDIIIGKVPINAFTMDWDIEDIKVRIGIERMAQ
ncbi:isoleucyl-tRNA synthetase [Vulcanisaeta moutnovskia 768-28]|uniref:Isoleucine--tRNA ligase n=1 Tax=Vulcanisaeta moutnovskia (strain 768-28) TaxID=985053 RepID=F0QX21_VULM7|nr:isoleucine--tRNA ligase [Vulcanisaeta moutnovskia]ADY02310.1 isoleucyl-tRNA synthetase [Vulcanisaeta moutnovskia 768-28]